MHTSIFGAILTTGRDLAATLRHALRLPYALNIKTIQSPRQPRQTYIFIHGIGNTLHSWDEVYEQLPEDVRIIGVDLLGFGDSPKPHRAIYDARLQARSVMRTLLKIPMRQRPILVGHSLGALVAVEMAKRYPIFFKRAVLCSPPLYISEGDRPLGRFSRDVLLRRLYRTIRRHPTELERLSPLAVRAGLANKSLSVTEETVGAYISSLEASIVNQSALRDIPRLKIPVAILYGTLDPLVVGAHIQAVAGKGSHVKVYKIVTGHEVMGRYAKRLVTILSELEPVSI
ncbi:alpha/beta fold hydrolase [Candidatus Saccharibacteria bacterium TM7i]|nr:alpha/beta fold hydrolase [Candidatus Saccharibacteria bacterium TM7i]